MSLILCLETSTKVCSVALGQNGKLLALKESFDEKHSHAENLTLYIQEVCAKAKIKLKDIDAVTVSKGPGSFTGLRIGVSTAKGLCYSLGKPLIAVNSLEAMAVGVSQKNLASVCLTAPSRGGEGGGEKKLPALFCPMIDAKRMEVYCAVYDEQLKEIKKTSAEIIDGHSFANLLTKHKMIFFGDGAEKCKAQIKHSNAHFIDEINPSAQFMIPIAEKYFTEKKFEDVAYFEPFYLKDFMGIKAQVPRPEGSQSQ